MKIVMNFKHIRLQLKRKEYKYIYIYTFCTFIRLCSLQNVDQLFDSGSDLPSIILGLKACDTTIANVMASEAGNHANFIVSVHFEYLFLLS